MYLSELIGQAIEHQQRQYTVGDVVFDDTGVKIETLILFSDDGEIAVSAKDTDLRAQKVTLHKDARLFVCEKRNNPVNAPLCTPKGKVLGTIRDCELKKYALKKLVLTKTQSLGRATLATENGRVVLVRPAKAAQSIAALPKVTASAEHETLRTVSALPADTPDVAQAPASAPPAADLTDAAPRDDYPARIIADYSFLLGRIVVSDILDGNEVVIPKGELILAKTVEVARRHAKLFDLTVKSRS